MWLSRYQFYSLCFFSDSLLSFFCSEFFFVCFIIHFYSLSFWCSRFFPLQFLCVLETCNFDLGVHFMVLQVKTTNPKKYCVRPNTGVVMPRSTCDVIGFFFSLYISIFPPSFTIYSPPNQVKDRFSLHASVLLPTKKKKLFFANTMTL